MNAIVFDDSTSPHFRPLNASQDHAILEEIVKKPVSPDTVAEDMEGEKNFFLDQIPEDSNQKLRF